MTQSTCVRPTSDSLRRKKNPMHEKAKFMKAHARFKNVFNRITNPVVLTDSEGNELSGLKGLFQVGEKVVIKNRTFEAVYVNDQFVGFELSSLCIKKEG